MARTENETSDRITETSAVPPTTLPADGPPKPAETRPLTAPLAKTGRWGWGRWEDWRWEDIS